MTTTYTEDRNGYNQYMFVKSESASTIQWNWIGGKGVLNYVIKATILLVLKEAVIRPALGGATPLSLLCWKLTASLQISILGQGARVDGCFSAPGALGRDRFSGPISPWFYLDLATVIHV